MKRLWKVGLVVVTVLALAGTAVGFVAAQTDGGGVPVPGKERLSGFVSKLAENLGISEDELEQAIRQTQLDLVDEAVEEGRLSDEQAGRVREQIESGERPFSGPRVRGHGGPCRAHGIVSAVAEFLGVPPGEVVSGLAQGMSLAQIAEEQGISAEELSAFQLVQVEDHLARAVEAGKISQERADQMLANAETQINRLINHEGSPPCQPHQRPDGPATEDRFPNRPSRDSFPGRSPEAAFPEA